MKYHKLEKNKKIIMGLLSVGKWWGPNERQPILALHGRQDNAGTFDTLMPLLSDDVSVLCLDLPGHGLSSHYPESQFYYCYWDGVILLRRIIKHFKWNKVSEWMNLPTLCLIETLKPLQQCDIYVL